MRTTHERERSEFRRSRYESAQKNRQGRSSLPLLLDFPTTRAQSASKAAFFSFFLWRIWELEEDIFSTLLLSQEDKIFTRRFLRSPHLCSSTGVYLYYSTHTYINKRKTKENTPTRTHACTSPRGARRSTRRRRREEEEEAIVRSLSPTNANRTPRNPRYR